jgi:hypothetical protein
VANNKRSDGFYQKNITVGRKEDGSYIRKTIYAKTKKELDIKAAEITQQLHQGIYVPEEKTTFGEITEIWLTQYNPTANEKWFYRQDGSFSCSFNINLFKAFRNSSALSSGSVTLQYAPVLVSQEALKYSFSGALKRG